MYHTAMSINSCRASVLKFPSDPYTVRNTNTPGSAGVPRPRISTCRRATKSAIGTSRGIPDSPPPLLSTALQMARGLCALLSARTGPRSNKCGPDHTPGLAKVRNHQGRSSGLVCRNSVCFYTLLLECGKAQPLTSS